MLQGELELMGCGHLADPHLARRPHLRDLRLGACVDLGDPIPAMHPHDHCPSKLVDDGDDRTGGEQSG